MADKRETSRRRVLWQAFWYVLFAVLVAVLDGPGYRVWLWVALGLCTFMALLPDLVTWLGRRTPRV